MRFCIPSPALVELMRWAKRGGNTSNEAAGGDEGGFLGSELEVEAELSFMVREAIRERGLGVMRCYITVEVVVGTLPRI